VEERVDYTVLGRTGLKVSRLGLGCGGVSRLGQKEGGSVKAAVSIVEHAIALGINVIDTAPVYDTEEIVAAALKGKRDEIVLSSKSLLPKTLSRLSPSSIGNRFYRYGSNLLTRLISGNELRRNIESSLCRLETDYLDICHLHAVTKSQYFHVVSELCHLHAVTKSQYFHVVSELLPTLERLREEGKIRFLGITETLADTDHRMLVKAMEDDCWDVMMMCFNFDETSGRHFVLPEARKRNVGIMIMSAAKPAVAGQPHRKLRSRIRSFSGSARIKNLSSRANSENSPFATAYRYCLDEPGVHVVLMGTGNREHLAANVRAINEGPLDPETRTRLEHGARISELSHNW
jgi:L-galactose dehydrogenase